jgi:hypothetical protein
MDPLITALFALAVLVGVALVATGAVLFGSGRRVPGVGLMGLAAAALFGTVCAWIALVTHWDAAQWQAATGTMVAITALAGVPFAIAALMANAEQSRTAIEQLSHQAEQTRIASEQLRHQREVADADRVARAEAARPQLRALGGSLGVNGYAIIQHVAGTDQASNVEVWVVHGELWLYGRQGSLLAQTTSNVLLNLGGPEPPAHERLDIPYAVLMWRDPQGADYGHSEQFGGEPHPLTESAGGAS